MRQQEQQYEDMTPAEMQQMEKERKAQLRAEFNALKKELLRQRREAGEAGEEEVEKIALSIMYQRQMEKEGPKV